MSNKRGLKNRKELSNAIDIKLWNALDALAEETQIPKSKLLDKAVTLLLQEYKKPIE